MNKLCDVRSVGSGCYDMDKCTDSLMQCRLLDLGIGVNWPPELNGSTCFAPWVFVIADSVHCSVSGRKVQNTEVMRK